MTTTPNAPPPPFYGGCRGSAEMIMVVTNYEGGKGLCKGQKGLRKKDLVQRVYGMILRMR